MSAAQEYVEGKLKSKSVMVFSKSYCPFCTKAKKVLAKYKISSEHYEVVEMEDRDDCSELQAYLKQKTGASSVPRVFIGGECIGGGDETASLDASGALEKKLKAAGAI